MESIKIKRKVRSSTLRIQELEKFKNKEVVISITPVEKQSKSLAKNSQNKSKEELLTISNWDISENDIKAGSWTIENY